MKKRTTWEIDWKSIGHTAAGYLLEQNRFETFLYVTEAGGADGAGRLRPALERTLRRNGFRGAVKSLILPAVGIGRKARLVSRELAAGAKPIAVLAANDRLATEVVAFALADGRSVPEDVAVLGIGDAADICTRSPVALSSVRLACEQLGHEILRRTLDPDHAAGCRDGSFICAPIGITERDSVRKTRPIDPYVARAVDFIRHGDARDLRVDTIVAFCGASRSYLEKRFRTETGAAILKTVHRRKLQDIERDLVETDKPAAIIAEEAGFSNESSLCSFFKRETGQSMSAFRRSRRPS